MKPRPLGKSVNRPFRQLHVVVGQTHASRNERYSAGEVETVLVGGGVDTCCYPCIFNRRHGSPLSKLRHYRLHTVLHM